MIRRKLALDVESLTPLETDELDAVVGAAPSGLTCPLRDCVAGLTQPPNCT